MAAIFDETNFFLKIGSATQQSYPVGQKFCRNRSILHGFRDKSIFVFCIFEKKKFKIQNGRHFWRVKYSLKFGKASPHRYPVGQIFCRICSIWHGFQDTSITVFCNFCEKFENSKWGQNIFENWVTYSAEVPCG